MMKQGIIQIVFGKEYDRLAVSTVKISRQNTNLPICILTNLSEGQRDGQWKEISGISFQKFDIPTKLNRDIKTQIIKYTPFEETLYIDCDAVIQRRGVEKIFEYLKGYDLLFPLWSHLTMKNLPNIYKKAIETFNVKLPLDAWHGALMCFRNTSKLQKFFERWNKYWKEFGCGRDMQCLACAVRKENLSVGTLPYDFFKWSSLNSNAIIQHYTWKDSGKSFREKFKLPYWKREELWRIHPL